MSANHKKDKSVVFRYGIDVEGINYDQFPESVCGTLVTSITDLNFVIGLAYLIDLKAGNQELRFKALSNA